MYNSGMKTIFVLLIVALAGALAAGNDSDRKWNLPGVAVYRVTDHQTISHNVDCYIAVRDLPMAPVAISCSRTN